jgi:hypothetical protein
LKKYEAAKKAENAKQLSDISKETLDEIAAIVKQKNDDGWDELFAELRKKYKPGKFSALSSMYELPAKLTVDEFEAFKSGSDLKAACKKYKTPTDFAYMCLDVVSNIKTSKKNRLFSDAQEKAVKILFRNPAAILKLSKKF